MLEQRSMWWKVYFLLVVLLSFVGFGLSFLGEGQFIFLEDNIFSNIYIGVMILIYFISLVGLWGFIYQKRVFYKEFWVYIFFIIVIELIGSSIMTPIETSTGETGYLFLILGLLIIGGVLLYFYALYQYAFKMTNLWRENEQ